MEGKTGLERSGKKRKAPRTSRQSHAAPGSLDERSPSAGGDGNPLVPGSASVVDEPGKNPWSEVMRDLARLVVAAHEADPNRFD